jgi:hypothetical protein
MESVNAVVPCTRSSLIPPILFNGRRGLNALLLRALAIRTNGEAMAFLLPRATPLTALPRPLRRSRVVIHYHNLALFSVLLRSPLCAKRVLLAITSWPHFPSKGALFIMCSSVLCTYSRLCWLVRSIMALWHYGASLALALALSLSLCMVDMMVRSQMRDQTSRVIFGLWITKAQPHMDLAALTQLPNFQRPYRCDN